MQEVEPAPTALRTLAQARIAQGITVGWMLVEGMIAIGAGVVAHSVALTAFGLDSFIELFSAAVVLRRVLERSESEERGSRTPGERTASRLVGMALYVLVVYIVVSAAAGLLLRLEPEPSLVGIGLTVVSIGIMTVLWRWRLNLADRLGSPALRGDAACSVVCLYMGVATLAGLALNASLGVVVGRSHRGSGIDLVDPRRSERGDRGSISVSLTSIRRNYCLVAGA